ncbi:unnamed protein product [Darwinula stevensoni]|uniref:C1q domain-containing protein n=1 Tax=Darwinula stevensoni TaxID=69355 RepID=A0A7R9ABT4_9CRUS|nr:unnamed protein product [Darwinula stevensoni]CAG0899722.1 unnamed protein product [Darwinula stevensoni]
MIQALESTPIHGRDNIGGTLDEMMLDLQTKAQEHAKQIEQLMTEIENLRNDGKILRDDNKKLKNNFENIRKDHENLKSSFQEHLRERDKLKLQLNTTEGRLQYLEAISLQIAPQTCQTLADLGVTQTGKYFVDPDGVSIGDAPIKVLCDMETDPVSTIVLHDSMADTMIDPCAGPGCYRRKIKYDASLKQMVALINQSTHCSQEIRFDCLSTALSIGERRQAWWVDRHGNPQDYWDGSNGEKHVCRCGLSNNCTDKALSCNCDAKAPQWESDSGAIINRTSLPLTELRFGGLQFAGQKAKYTLGGLACRGKASSSSENPAESCSSLRRTGNTRSGYYLIQKKNGRLDVVLCRMDFEDSDAGFQLDTGARIIVKGVYFDAYLTSHLHKEGVITFSGTVVNIGNGMVSSTGIFTAPLDGIYAFHFHYLGYGDVSTRVDLRRNRVIKGAMVARPNESEIPSQAIFLSLNLGDEIDWRRIIQLRRASQPRLVFGTIVSELEASEPIEARLLADDSFPKRLAQTAMGVDCLLSQTELIEEAGAEVVELLAHTWR